MYKVYPYEICFFIHAPTMYIIHMLTNIKNINSVGLLILASGRKMSYMRKYS